MTSLTRPAVRSMPRRLLTLCAVATLAGAALPAAGQAAEWPSKPIRFVVGFAPGGGTDLLARVVAQPLAEALGTSVIVENRPGGSGNISVSEVIRARPDGNTFLVAPTSVETVNPSLFKAKFDPAKDLVPVGTIARMQMYLVGRNDLPADDTPGLVKMAKDNPNKLTYASSGSGTPPHLAGELFAHLADIEVAHLPYKGSAPALQDVLGGHADYVFDPGIAMPHIREQKVKLLGVASATRSKYFPDTPTLSEQGIAGAELDIWFGVWAPLKTPPEIIERLQSELVKVLALPAVEQRFADAATEAVARGGAEFRKLLDDERKLLEDLIETRNITAD